MTNHEADIRWALQTPGTVLEDSRTGRLWLVCLQQSTHRYPRLSPLGKAHQQDDYMEVKATDRKHFARHLVLRSVPGGRGRAVWAQKMVKR